MKLNEISWNVTEEEYRKDSALSYSTIAKYEREGFNNLDKLFDHISTPSLTFGSVVDSLMTGGDEEFNSRFFVADFPAVPDSIVSIINELFKEFHLLHTNLCSIPDNDIISVASRYNYQNNWKPETRTKVIKEKGKEYYGLLYLSKDKTLINTETYQDAINCVDALKSSEATRLLFANNNPFDGIERYYQLKFKATFDGIPYRCMMDLAVVIPDKKLIIPCDLKTSSHTEWDFETSFKQWHYMIQARLYAKILKDNISRYKEFEGYTIDNYKFIVVNRKTLTPLVWEFPYTFCDVDLKDEQGNIYRNPCTIGKELYNYLKDRPRVPNGIYTDKPNVINCFTIC